MDALEGRFAAAMGHCPPTSAAAARDVSERLSALEKALHPTSTGAPLGLACRRNWCCVCSDLSFIHTVISQSNAERGCEDGLAAVHVTSYVYHQSAQLARHQMDLASGLVAAAGLPRRVARLGARAEERLEAAEEARADDDSQPNDLDDKSLRQLLSLLKQQQASLSALEVRPKFKPAFARVDRCVMHVHVSGVVRKNHLKMLMCCVLADSECVLGATGCAAIGQPGSGHHGG